MVGNIWICYAFVRCVHACIAHRRSIDRTSRGGGGAGGSITHCTNNTIQSLRMNCAPLTTNGFFCCCHNDMCVVGRWSLVVVCTVLGLRSASMYVLVSISLFDWLSRLGSTVPHWQKYEWKIMINDHVYAAHIWASGRRRGLTWRLIRCDEVHRGARGRERAAISGYINRR